MTVAAPRSGLLRGPDGALEYLIEGEGGPVTVVGHGLTRTIPDTRPFVNDVSGTRAFLHFRGHGGSPDPGGDWTFDGLADELRTLAERTAATRAVAVSLSCRTLATLALADPGRFERLVFVLPPAMFGDHSRAHRDLLFEHLREIGSGDPRQLVAGLTAALPSWMNRQDPRSLLARGVAEPLLRRPQLAASVITLAERDVDFQLDRLAGIEVPTLVVGQSDDRLHPRELAWDMAGILPRGTYYEIGECRSFAAYRRMIRTAIADFLGPGTP
ncbi:alpha/beta fold hydrolase [Amycolatopsis sp. WQ 127309]|uniref:alpha/beta fold hydrolase n=1 Tax=Amycolatopsis sp. WQ 127309 TaxID=2932773 RepID=UPI001FF5C9F2|nr:alpha/beta hydrolase [Amycolatopsis sp. WQ 127309]UOZ07007.1 alpha/beta hydrolase [Amycolatopsis sp. WQ 127309]